MFGEVYKSTGLADPATFLASISALDKYRTNNVIIEGYESLSVPDLLLYMYDSTAFPHEDQQEMDCSDMSSITENNPVASLKVSPPNNNSMFVPCRQPRHKMQLVS